MILVLSGEGPTDIGQIDAGTFQPGPMARLADRIIQLTQGYDYSYIENHSAVFVHKSELKGDRPKALLAGKKRRVNTPEDKWFLRNAAALARKAMEVGQERSDTTLAILFRDADRPREYEAKRKSILHGYALEDYSFGVAMVPVPTSEAWLMSSQKGGADSLDGKRLEEWTDKVGLKEQLSSLVGTGAVRDLDPDPDSISPRLESFAEFRTELEGCVRKVHQP